MKSREKKSCRPGRVRNSSVYGAIAPQTVDWFAGALGGRASSAIKLADPTVGGLILEVQRLAHHVSACDRDTVVGIFAAGKCRPARLDEIGVSLPYAHRRQLVDQTAIGIGRLLEFRGADGRQCRDHGRFTRSRHPLVGGAAELPNAPVKADKQRDGDAYDQALQQPFWRLSLQIWRQEFR